MYLSTKDIYVIEEHGKLVTRVGNFEYNDLASDAAMTCLSIQQENTKWRAPEQADLVNDFEKVDIFNL